MIQLSLKNRRILLYKHWKIYCFTWRIKKIYIIWLVFERRTYPKSMFPRLLELAGHPPLLPRLPTNQHPRPLHHAARNLQNRRVPYTVHVYNRTKNSFYFHIFKIKQKKYSYSLIVFFSLKRVIFIQVISTRAHIW